MDINFKLDDLTEQKVNLLENICSAWRRQNTVAKPKPMIKQTNQISMLDVMDDSPESKQETSKPAFYDVTCTRQQMESILGLKHGAIVHISRNIYGMSDYINYNIDTSLWQINRKFFEGFPTQLEEIKSGKVLTSPIWYPTSVINQKLSDINQKWSPSTFGRYGVKCMQFGPGPNRRQAYYLTDIRQWKKTRPTYYQTIMRGC